MNKWTRLAGLATFLAAGAAMADDLVSYSRLGDINETRIVGVFLKAEIPTEFLAIENSGLSKKDIKALKDAAVAIDRSHRNRARLYYQKLCNEGAAAASNRAQFEAFYWEAQRELHDGGRIMTSSMPSTDCLRLRIRGLGTNSRASRSARPSGV